MELEIFKIFCAIAGSFIASFTAVKIELKWIVRELDKHAAHHTDHYNELEKVRDRLRYAKR
jgi:hypothetical protein